MKFFSRRKFLKYSVAGLASSSSLGCAVLSKKGPVALNAARLPLTGTTGPADPVARLGNILPQQVFSGDDPTRGHAFLWKKAETLQAKGGIPAPSETARVVIIGGGISGLSAAYHLRDLNPIVLEQAGQMGGNSRGESWDGLNYSIGAAYIATPSEDAASAQFLKEIGIFQKGREDLEGEGGHFLHGKKILSDFWQGASDPARAAEFVRVAEVLKFIREKKFPEVPPKSTPGLSLEEFETWDRMSFKAWTQKQMGTLHPHIEEFFEQYCWSSFGGGMDELSAAQALNFVASDVAGLVAFPGGNSAITQRLFEILQKALPPGNLRESTLAVDVSLQDGGARKKGVRVVYEDRAGRLQTIWADRCLVCAPKFIARRLIDDLPEAQQQAIARMRYRAYVVANLLLKKKVPSVSYDVFRLVGKLPGDRMKESMERPFTDLIYGNWADHDSSDRSVLTLYKSYPFEGARPILYAADAFKKVQTQFERSLPEILSALSLSKKDVVDLRVTRWGHPLPLADIGFLAGQVFQTASQSLSDRIFFAQQDNYGNPAFEGAYAAVEEAVTQIKKSLIS